MIRKTIQYVKTKNIKSEYLKWLYQYSKPYIPRILLVLFFNIATSLLAISMAVISKHIIDSATQEYNLLVWAVLLYRSEERRVGKEC